MIPNGQARHQPLNLGVAGADSSILSPPLSLEYQVVHNTDDQTWTNVAFSINQLTFGLGFDALVRFELSALPRDYYDARLIVNVSSAAAKEISIRGETPANQVAPASRAQAVARTQTSAQVIWPFANTTGIHTSPDITSLIDEILQAGALTSSLSFFLSNTSGAGVITATDYSNSPDSAAKLVFRYYGSRIPGNVRAGSAPLNQGSARSI